MGSCLGSRAAEPLDESDSKEDLPVLPCDPSDGVQATDPDSGCGCEHPYLRQVGSHSFSCWDCHSAVRDGNRLREERVWRRRVLEEDQRRPERESCLGVSLEWLLEFTEKHDLWEVSSRRVCRQLVLPLTRTHRCRFIDLPMVTPHVGKALTYICHSWDAPFGLLIAAARDTGASLSRHVWVDILCRRVWPSDFDSIPIIRESRSILVVSPQVVDMIPLTQEQRLNWNLKSLTASVKETIPFFRLLQLIEIDYALSIPEIVFQIRIGDLRCVDSKWELRNEYSEDVTYLLSSVIDASKALLSDDLEKQSLIHTMQKLNRTYPEISRSVRTALLQNMESSEGLEALLTRAAIGDPQPAEKILSERDSQIRAMFLVECCRWGFLSLLEKQFTSGYLDDPGIDAKYFGGITPCMMAAHSGHVNCLSLLLRLGCDIDATDDHGRTACILSTAAGNVSCLQILIENGCDVNRKATGGRTACYLACMHGYVACLKVLLGRKDMDVNSSTDDGMTPCMVAAACGHDICLKLLLQHECDIDVKDAAGNDAITLAAQGGHGSCREILRRAASTKSRTFFDDLQDTIYMAFQ